MLELNSVDLKRGKVGTLMVPVCQDGVIHADRTVSALIAEATSLPEFSGKKEESVTLFRPAETGIHRAVFFGLGKVADLTGESLRAFTGKAARFCIDAGLTAMTVATPSVSGSALDAPTLFRVLMEGACLGNHVDDRYKLKKEKQPLKTTVIMATAAQKRAYAGLAASVEIVCAATIRAREWVTTPSNDKQPEAFAAQIQQAAAAAGLKTRLRDHRWLKKQGFGAMLAVGQGSLAKPCLLTLEHAPATAAAQTVVLVGKGVTFDSGGINLKPTGSIETMKMDMSGAAAVAGTMLAVARLKPDLKVVGVLPLVENMPSGSAIRPGDIIRSYAGKTVEIGNTDAEGRLILIDAMAWAIKHYQPDTMIDLATLTGACMVALGEKIAGVFSTDASLAADIVASGEATHDRCWQLPLPTDYKELLKNEFADLNNVSSGRWGGAITAALFLSEFVGDTRWAHIDIAGPAWNAKATDYCGAGGTGFGVRLLCDWLATR